MRVVVQREPAADIDQRVFLAAHRAAVGIGTELPQDGGNVLIPIAGLTLLNEIGVLDRPRRIQHHADSMTMGELAHLAHIRHRYGLAAGHVHGARHANIGNAFGTDFLYQRLKRIQIDIAFEGALIGRIVRFRHDDVDECSAGQFLVQSRGSEIHIAGHDVARLDQHARQ